MSGWRWAARRESVPAVGMMEVEVGGRPLVIARPDGERLYVFAAHCPHASASLVEGTLRPDYVICPLHAYRFALGSGRCLKPRDGPSLRVFDSEWREDGLWVRL